MWQSVMRGSLLRGMALIRCWSSLPKRSSMSISHSLLTGIKFDTCQVFNWNLSIEECRPLVQTNMGDPWWREDTWRHPIANNHPSLSLQHPSTITNHSPHPRAALRLAITNPVAFEIIFEFDERRPERGLVRDSIPCMFSHQRCAPHPHPRRRKSRHDFSNSLMTERGSQRLLRSREARQRGPTAQGSFYRPVTVSQRAIRQFFALVFAKDSQKILRIVKELRIRVTQILDFFSFVAEESLVAEEWCDN